LREYEVTIILKPDLDEEARSQVVERVEDWLTHGEGDEFKPVADYWGQRALAYPIKKYTEGYYILYNAKMDPKRISDVERNILYVDDILRHLVFRKPE
jgi:small subunit ribosomal protein S6